MNKMKTIIIFVVLSNLLSFSARAMVEDSPKGAFTYINSSSYSQGYQTNYSFLGPQGLAADGNYYPIALPIAELKKDDGPKSSTFMYNFKVSFCANFGLLGMGRYGWIPTGKGETYITGIMAMPQTQKKSDSKYGRITVAYCYSLSAAVPPPHEAVAKPIRF